MNDNQTKAAVIGLTGSFGLWIVGIALGMVGIVFLVPNAAATCPINIGNDISDCNGGNCLANISSLCRDGSTCIVNVHSQCLNGGSCEINVLFSDCHGGSCLVNAVLAECNGGASCAINVATTC